MAVRIAEVVFWSGFGFLVFVGIWAIVTIERMKAKQVIALSVLQQLAERATLRSVMATTRVEDQVRQELGKADATPAAAVTTTTTTTTTKKGTGQDK